jgi:cysteinyl-tRNA synthetase
MSKSKGEFLTVSLLEEKGYGPIAYRFFCLQSHYRKNLVFSWENLDNAKIAFDKLISRVAALKDDGALDEAAFASGKALFTDALDNDLNTAGAITALYDVFKLNTNDKTKLMLIDDFDKVLSLDLIKKAQAQKTSSAAKEDAAPDVDPALLAYIEAKILERKEAKKNKDFALADAVRAELLAKGITLIDTREGTKFEINK